MSTIPRLPLSFLAYEARCPQGLDGFRVWSDIVKIEPPGMGFESKPLALEANTLTAMPPGLCNEIFIVK